MERFSSQATIADVFNDKILSKYAKYLFYKFPFESKLKRIDEISWYARDGLNFFYQKCLEKTVDIFDVSNSRKNTKIIQISHKNHEKFCIIVSGGALTYIDTFHEGLPIAERMYIEGYDVFLLNYEVGSKAKKLGPSKDINNAVRFIIQNNNKLKVDVDDFVIIGCSAGGYIASQYCSNNLGYKKNNNQRPGCLCLLYPVIKLNPNEETCLNALGKNPSDFLIRKYSSFYHVGNTFPPTFIVHSKDDNAVPYQTSIKLKEELDKISVLNKLLLYETGNHGWGIGYRLEPATWFEQFIDFLKSINI